MPIIYSNYKKTNNGFNIGGQEIGFLSEIPFGIQYFETLKIWEKLAKECGLIQYCTPLEDELGESARTSVRGLALVGDGNTYVKFDDFTDADLPTNYVIEWDGIYNENAEFKGFFGFENTSPNNLFVASRATLGRIYGEFYGSMLNLSTSLQLGDVINIKLIVNNGFVKLNVNGQETANQAFTQNLSNQPIILLAREGGVNPSLHTMQSFKITNTDTNEVIFNPNFEMRQSDGIIESLASDGSKITGEQFISPDTPTVFSLMESEQDKQGVTFAKALGLKLDNMYSRNQISSSGAISVLLSSLLTDDMFIVELGQEYTTKIRSNLFTPDVDLALVAYYDNDMNFIERISIGGTYSDEINWTSDYNGFARIYLFRVKNDDTDITNAELDDLTVMTNEGSSALPYESWEGYYRDSALLFPYEDGTPILTNYAYVSDGMGGSKKNTVEFNGPIKKNFRVVDGVISELISKQDLVVSTENIGEIDYIKLMNNGFAGALTDDIAVHVTFKTNTQYTINVDAYELNDSNNLRIRFNYTDASFDDIFVPTTTEQNFIKTSDAGKTIESITWAVSTGLGTTYIRKDTFYCYEGISIPPGQPSGVYESGNSKILDQVYDGIGGHDDNRILTDSTHEPKLITFDDDPLESPDPNPQYLTSQDKQKSSFYKEPLVEGSDCFIKAKKLMDFNGTAIDSNGEIAVDQNDFVAFEY